MYPCVMLRQKSLLGSYYIKLYVINIPLQEHVAFISEEDLENPHIRHFNHLNPGWNKVTAN